jgi:hypothetical protein
MSKKPSSSDQYLSAGTLFSTPAAAQPYESSWRQDPPSTTSGIIITDQGVAGYNSLDPSTKYSQPGIPV